ncbi:unnamed protein product [Ilex paraguariensis]|uniref:Uncharacterized protein n=1 Tax=Ilex paraguariensis TaxID=185542 RepID=A0ABC8T028_9AQUA
MYYAIVGQVTEDELALLIEVKGQHLLYEESTEFCKVKLSCLFGWLVHNLKQLKPTHQKSSAAETEVSSTKLNLPKDTLAQFLRKCLLVSSSDNHQLISSALNLANMMGNSPLAEKLNKLCKLGLSNRDTHEENSSLTSFESFLSQQEDSIRQAAAKLENIKLHRMKANYVKTTDGDMENRRMWAVAKSWNPCPIGMLPHSLRSSGHLPVLDCNDDCKIEKSSESIGHCEINHCSGKRGADCAIELLDESSVKKLKESEEGCESNGKEDMSPEGVKGQLLVGGVWKKVTEEELLAITSAVRILV